MNYNLVLRKVPQQHYALAWFRKLYPTMYIMDGIQLMPHFDKPVQNVYTAWRVAMRRVWRLPWRTHNKLLPHIADVMPPEFSFAKRTIKFIQSCLESDNITVRTISNMGLHGSYSIMGANFNHFNYKWNMDICDVCKSWKNLYHENKEILHISSAVKELVQMRDCCVGGVLTRGECTELIELLCTD